MRKVLAMHKSALGELHIGDVSAPRITLLQEPRLGGPHGLWDLAHENRATSEQFANTWEGITDSIRILCSDAVNVDSFCLTCNTLHMLEPDLREWMRKEGLPEEKFISIIQTTDGVIRKISAAETEAAVVEQSVSIFGSFLTTDINVSPYRIVAPELLKPVAVDIRSNLQKVINDTKHNGSDPIPEALKDRFRDLILNHVESIRGKENVRNHKFFVVLGCTEFALLLEEDRLDWLEKEMNIVCVNPAIGLAAAQLAHFHDPKRKAEVELELADVATDASNGCDNSDELADDLNDSAQSQDDDDYKYCARSNDSPADSEGVARDQAPITDANMQRKFGHGSTHATQRNFISSTGVAPMWKRSQHGSVPSLASTTSGSMYNSDSSNELSRADNTLSDSKKMWDGGSSTTTVEQLMYEARMV